jgi:hypothetical protein
MKGEPAYPDQNLSRSALDSRVSILSHRIAAQHKPSALGVYGGMFNPAVAFDVDELRAELAELSDLRDHYNERGLPVWTEWMDWAKARLLELKHARDAAEKEMLRLWQDGQSTLPAVREWTAAQIAIRELQVRMRPVSAELGWKLSPEKQRMPWGGEIGMLNMTDPRAVCAAVEAFLAAYGGKFQLPAPPRQVRNRRPITSYDRPA